MVRVLWSWFSYVVLVLATVVVAGTLAVLLGYFPFTPKLGGGWDGWFVGDEVARMNLVSSAGRLLLVPLLTSGSALAVVEALIRRAVSSPWLGTGLLLLAPIVATLVALRLAGGGSLVSPDLRAAALVGSGLYAALLARSGSAIFQRKTDPAGPAPNDRSR